ncbi:MAG TPA: hypothetical protein VKX17_05975 [Planctomycetota bacterium]|nr:hypothetical protein [Planctomycetota bacterium]
MDVIWHEHVGAEVNAIFFTRGADGFQKAAAMKIVRQQIQSLKRIERQEMAVNFDWTDRSLSPSEIALWAHDFVCKNPLSFITE